MRAAIISAGVVARVILVNSLAEFPGAIDGTNADVGDLWNGTVFSKPAQTFNQVRAAKKDEIASRWAMARGAGYLFQAKRIATDALSSAQISLIGARSRRAKEDTEAFSMIWVCADETTLNLSHRSLHSSSHLGLLRSFQHFSTILSSAEPTSVMWLISTSS